MSLDAELLGTSGADAGSCAVPVPAAGAGAGAGAGWATGGGAPKLVAGGADCCVVSELSAGWLSTTRVVGSTGRIATARTSPETRDETVNVYAVPASFGSAATFVLQSYVGASSIAPPCSGENDGVVSGHSCNDAPGVVPEFGATANVSFPAVTPAAMS